MIGKLVILERLVETLKNRNYKQTIVTGKNKDTPLFQTILIQPREQNRLNQKMWQLIILGVDSRKTIQKYNNTLWKCHVLNWPKETFLGK